MLYACLCVCVHVCVCFFRFHIPRTGTLGRFRQTERRWTVSEHTVRCSLSEWPNGKLTIKSVAMILRIKQDNNLKIIQYLMHRCHRFQSYINRIGVVCRLSKAISKNCYAYHRIKKIWFMWTFLSINGREKNLLIKFNIKFICKFKLVFIKTKRKRMKSVAWNGSSIYYGFSQCTNQSASNARIPT